MNMINITPHILGEKNKIYAIRNWLYANVGSSLHTNGKYPMVGQGWEIVTKAVRLEDPHYPGSCSTWWIKFDDERLATLFALSWSQR